MKLRTARKAVLTGAFLLLAAPAWAQTLTVPITGSATLPDGTKVTLGGQATVTVTLPPPPPVYGPREAVGPGAPLTTAETLAFARRVTVAGFTTAAIQTACDQAKAQGIPVVYLPAGTYTLAGFVNVPGGITVLGAGATTVLKPATAFVECLYTRGDNVRYTRLKLLGPAADQWLQGDSQATARAIEVWGNQNVRVDHCDIAGFAYAVLFQNNATGQVDHNSLHHNQVIGYGYGVSAAAGAQVTVTDNEFSDNRHSLASNGHGTRPTTWEFSHNRVGNIARSANQRASVDTHPGFDGTFTATANSFENVDTGFGLYAGAGTILGNRFANLDTAVQIAQAAENGVVGVPHDISASSNVFVGTVLTRYTVAPGALRVTVDGRLWPPPGARKPGQERKKR